MAQQITTLAIVFADISGSTRLYESLGDERGRQVVARCLETMTGVVREHGGTIIKTIGDEVMCTFPEAEAAVEAAADMQEAISEELPARDRQVPSGLSIRVGLHYGSAIVDGGDVFGDAVNIAARMAGQAEGGQIITTEPTIGELPPALRANTRCIDRIPVRGKSEHIQIHEVIWQQEDVTYITPTDAAARANGVRLHLWYRGNEVTVNPQSGPLTLGRGKGATMVIRDKLASREHARIEHRKGKFVLSDRSTNGTYVLTAGGSVFLRREEITLLGRGKISLGRSFEEDPQEIVIFDCEP